MMKTIRSNSDSTCVKMSNLRRKKVPTSASFDLSRTDGLNDQTTGNGAGIEETRQRKSSIMRLDIFMEKNDLESMEDDESYINAVIADIGEDASPPPNKRRMSFFTMKPTLQDDRCAEKRTPAVSSRWQLVKKNLLKAASGIEDIRRKSVELSGLGRMLNSKSQSESLSHFAKEACPCDESAEEAEEKRVITQKKSLPKVKFLPFCEKYDGFSCRKTKTISESIQAILEQKKQEEKTKMRNIVEERVAEMLTPPKSPSMLMSICNDWQMNEDIDEKHEKLYEQHSKYNPRHLRYKYFGIGQHETDCIEDQKNSMNSNLARNAPTQLESSVPESPMYEDNAIKELTERHVVQFFESFYKRYDSKYSGMIMQENITNNEKRNVYGMKKASALNNKYKENESNKSTCLSELSNENYRKKTATELEETSWLNKNEQSHLLKMQQLPCRNCRIDKNSSMHITIRVPSQNKLIIDVDRIESLCELPHAKAKRETLVKVCIMPRSGMKQKKTKGAKGKNTVIFKETMSFDMVTTDTITSGSIRFQVCQKRTSFFRSQFVCVGESLVWLDELDNPCGKSQIVANIYPFL